MKKLLIIHHSSVIGGAGISLFNIIQLIKTEYDVTIYVSDLHTDYFDFLKSHGINAIKYKGRIPAFYYHASSGGLKNVAFWHRLLKIPLQFNFWKKVIKDTNPDLIIVNSVILCWFSLLTKNKKIKSLCFVRETFFKNSILSKLQFKLLSYFTGVSYISEFDLKMANLPNNVKTYVNHDYLMVQPKVEPATTQKDFFSVLYIGGMSKFKGVDMVINAANVLKSNPSIQFNLLGENYSSITKNTPIFKRIYNRNYQLSKKIMQQVEHLNLDNTIKFHGIQKNMDAFYNECDVLICPINTPHQQRGIFEAGWFSKPVIVSDFEELHWVVKKGFNGDLFQPGNSEDLAQKIEFLFDNPEVCKQQGRNNNLMTLENHTMEICNSKVEVMLKEII